MAKKVIKLQEQQLFDMLDSVPDKVLVCSFEHQNELKPKPMYNNRQMREFFGGSLVEKPKTEDKSKKNKKSAPKKSQSFRHSTFEKRIFSQREIDSPVNLNDSPETLISQFNRDRIQSGDVENQLLVDINYSSEISLSEIVTRH